MYFTVFQSNGGILLLSALSFTPPRSFLSMSSWWSSLMVVKTKRHNNDDERSTRTATDVLQPLSVHESESRHAEAKTQSNLIRGDTLPLFGNRVASSDDPFDHYFTSFRSTCIDGTKSRKTHTKVFSSIKEAKRPHLAKATARQQATADTAPCKQLTATALLSKARTIIFLTIFP